MGQKYKLVGVERGIRPQAYLGITTTHKQHITVNKVSESQLTTQGQSFAANLASPETMIEPVLNDDHAMIK
jgi:hypothetical protein